jgi:hypothetical protein
MLQFFESRLSLIASALDSPLNKLFYPSNHYDLVACDKNTRGCLYMGDIDALTDVEFMKEVGAVISVVDGFPADFWKTMIGPNRAHLLIPVMDLPYVNLRPHFKPSYAFIESHLSQGHNVYVHCMAGISRSSTIVLYWLMRKFQMNLLEALTFLKQQRPIIRPNDGFLLQLGGT